MDLCLDDLDVRIVRVQTSEELFVWHGAWSYGTTLSSSLCFVRAMNNFGTHVSIVRALAVPANHAVSFFRLRATSRWVSDATVPPPGHSSHSHLSRVAVIPMALASTPRKLITRPTVIASSNLALALVFRWTTNRLNENRYWCIKLKSPFRVIVLNLL